MRSASLSRAIKVAGGVGALARLVGVTSQAVSQWERPPAEHIPIIERETGVPCRELRPDLYKAAPQRRGA